MYDESKESLGAHCGVRAHGGLCRANKVLARHGVGYLCAWLMFPHDCVMGTKVEHQAILKYLRSDLGYPDRCRARQWLVDREDTYKALLDLERKYHALGSFDEPEKIKH